ncbi:hypothetical protein AJ88_03605 [Mesorhizobium amorphae CCBAU 01583]|nr:hypothetical protein AJ88_03605 [Mesorhizobium amorphae CCBAU 01583]
MIFSPKKGDGAVIPLATEISPSMIEIKARLASLGEEAAKLREEDIAIALPVGPEEVDSAREARLAEILGRTPPRVTLPRSQRRQEIGLRLRDIEDARDLLHREMATERSRATAVVQDRLMPEYKRMMRGLLDALIAAHTAQVEIRTFVSRVEDAGFNTGWLDAHPCRWLDVGPNGNIGRFIDEKKKAGFIADRDIPENLK